MNDTESQPVDWTMDVAAARAVASLQPAQREALTVLYLRRIAEALERANPVRERSRTLEDTE